MGLDSVVLGVVGLIKVGVEGAKERMAASALISGKGNPFLGSTIDVPVVFSVASI